MATPERARLVTRGLDCSKVDQDGTCFCSRETPRTRPKIKKRDLLGENRSVGRRFSEGDGPGFVPPARVPDRLTNEASVTKAKQGKKGITPRRRGEGARERRKGFRGWEPQRTPRAQSISVRNPRGFPSNACRGSLEPLCSRCPLWLNILSLLRHLAALRSRESKPIHRCTPPQPPFQ